MIRKHDMKKRLLEVSRGHGTDRTPIWLMRQAGRYLKGYQKLRKKYSFLSLCKNPELAVEISMEPYHEFGMDGVILFSDIMIPTEPMGVEIDFIPGPVVKAPIQTIEEVNRLRVPDAFEELHYVMKTLRIIQSEVSSETTVIGFSGCPFTTAIYLIEGKHVPHFPKVRHLMQYAPDVLHALLEKLYATLLNYLRAQHASGAEVLQIFDSGTYLLSKEEYLTFAYPYEKKLISELKPSVPVILYVKETRRFIEEMKYAESSVISIDNSMSLAEAKTCLGDNVTLQGNLNPEVLASGSRDEIHKEVALILETMGVGNHIFNLGHGVLKHTPINNVQYLVDKVKNYVG